MLIVVDNWKSGTGKTTISVHIAMQLLLNKKKVVILYWVNNSAVVQCMSNIVYSNLKFDLIMIPEHIQCATAVSVFIKHYKKVYDYVIVDSVPEQFFEILYCLAHIIFTPISDSLIDLYSIVNTINNYTPSQYSTKIWNVRVKRCKDSLPVLTWYIVLNRYSLGKSKNRDKIIMHLKNIVKKFGANYIEGMADRVVYKSLFLGLDNIFSNKRRVITPALNDIVKITNCILDF
ncbi:MAG: division plane positioning ATPase MipZ [Pseudomonadota bacterium]